MGGAAFKDPSCLMDGHVVFCECRVVDGSNMTAAAKMVAVYVDRGSGEARRVPPSVLLDLEPGGAAPPCSRRPAMYAAGQGGRRGDGRIRRGGTQRQATT